MILIIFLEPSDASTSHPITHVNHLNDNAYTRLQLHNCKRNMFVVSTVVGNTTTTNKGREYIHEIRVLRVGRNSNHPASKFLKEKREEISKPKPPQTKFKLFCTIVAQFGKTGTFEANSLENFSKSSTAKGLVNHRLMRKYLTRFGLPGIGSVV